ncbi:24514_t:CDS:2, partial [Dentiscutata erythropus]
INKYKNDDPRKLQFQKANDALVRILRSIVNNCRDNKKVEKARSILNTKDYCSLFNDGNEEELSHLIDDNVLNEETNLSKFNEINLELEKELKMTTVFPLIHGIISKDLIKDKWGEIQSLVTNEARNKSNNPFQRAKIGHKANMKGILKNTSCKLEALYGEVSGGLEPFGLSIASRKKKYLDKVKLSIMMRNLINKTLKQWRHINDDDRKSLVVYGFIQDVKNIKDQIRRLSKEICGVPREDESIKSRIEWFTRLKEFTETSSADNLLLFEKIYLNFEAKKENLCQETDRLQAELSETKNNLEQFRKENEGHKRYYEQTQREYLSTIEYLQNRVDQLELYLDIGTSNYIVKNESGDKMDVSSTSRATTFTSLVVAVISVAASSDIPDSASVEYVGNKADSTNNLPEETTSN